jgi:hypothetical protein
VNARAEPLRPPRRQLAAARAEHISLEGDLDAPVAAKQPHRITRMSYTLASPMRGYETELALLEGHYLNVRSVRPDAPPLKYQFDLRFAHPQPVRVRRIAWSWLVTALGLAALGAGALYTGWSAASAPWTTAVIGGALTVLLSIVALWLFVRGATESLEFRSAHGGAPLVSVTAGLGATRAGKPFFVELIKSIHAAKRERSQQKAQFLRDEMREHHRLRELQVLSEEDYEASKARILAAH